MASPTPVLYIRPVDLPGLYDCQLLDASGWVLGEFSDITSGQVNHIASQHGARIEQVPST